MSDDQTRTSHTPGPWIVADSNSYRRIVNIHCDPVCHPTTQRDGHPDLVLPNGGYRGSDARLIAAAPELYEALREAVKWIEESTEGDSATRMALDALAKAEGRNTGGDHE